MVERLKKKFTCPRDAKIARELDLVESTDALGLLSTYREVFKYANTFFGVGNAKYFVETHLRDKAVLDLGSGYGGLAIDAAIKGLGANIHSVSPQYASREYGTYEYFSFIKFQVESSLLAQYWTAEEIARYSTQIDKAIARWICNSYAALGHNLPFTEGSFDTVLDHYACGFSASKYSLGGHLYIPTLKEVSRVLKPNGMYLVGPLEQTKDGVSTISLVERFCETTQLMRIIDEPRSCNRDVLFLQKNP